MHMYFEAWWHYSLSTPGWQLTNRSETCAVSRSGLMYYRTVVGVVSLLLLCTSFLNDEVPCDQMLIFPRTIWCSWQNNMEASQQGHLHYEVMLLEQKCYPFTVHNMALEAYVENQDSPKISCFVWLVCRKAFPTHEVLQRRGKQICSRCFMCTLDAEVNSHLFLHCKTVANLWNMFFCLLRVHWVIPKTTRGMPNSWKGIGRRESEEDWRELVGNDTCMCLVDLMEGKKCKRFWRQIQQPAEDQDELS